MTAEQQTSRGGARTTTTTAASARYTASRKHARSAPFRGRRCRRKRERGRSPGMRSARTASRPPRRGLPTHDRTQPRRARGRPGRSRIRRRAAHGPRRSTQQWTVESPRPTSTANSPPANQRHPPRSSGSVLASTSALTRRHARLPRTDRPLSLHKRASTLGSRVTGRPNPFAPRRSPAKGWSIYGAQRAQPVATGGKWNTLENRSNKPIRNRWQPTATVPERMVRRGSPVRVRKRALHKRRTSALLRLSRLAPRRARLPLLMDFPSSAIAFDSALQDR